MVNDKLRKVAHRKIRVPVAKFSLLHCSQKFFTLVVKNHFFVLPKAVMRAHFLFLLFRNNFTARGMTCVMLLLLCGCSSAERTPQKGVFDAFKPDRMTRFFSEDESENETLSRPPREKTLPKNSPKNTSQNFAQNSGQNNQQSIIQQNASRDAIKIDSPQLVAPQLTAPQTQSKPNWSPPPPPPEPQLPQAKRAIPEPPRAAKANEETPTAHAPNENRTENTTNSSFNSSVNSAIPPAPIPVLSALSSRAKSASMQELSDDPPELKLLLSDLKNAADVDAEKSIKLVSELRKIDAESDPSFYKNMVGFARTTLLRKTSLASVEDECADELEDENAAEPVEIKLEKVAGSDKNPAPKPVTRSTRPAPRAEEESIDSVLSNEEAENLIAPPLLSSAARTTLRNNSAQNSVSNTEENQSEKSSSQKSQEIPSVRFVSREQNFNSENSGNLENSPTSIIPVSYHDENVMPKAMLKANGNAGNADDWQANVRQAAAQLRGRAVSTQDEVRLRFLELALGNQQEAARPIDGIDTSTRAFWASEMLGLSVLLDERTFPETSSRNAASIHHLARAQNDLRHQCPLKIQQMKFVDKWYGFGSYTPLAGDFNVGETVSLYLELENITVRESPLGHNTRSSSSYVLIDGAGTVVSRVENITAEETSQARRRDSCLMIPVTIPKTISPGPYQLKITVTDLNHDKLQYAVEQVPLRIKSSYPQNGE